MKVFDVLVHTFIFLLDINFGFSLEFLDKDEGQNVTLKCPFGKSNIQWIVSDPNNVGKKPRSQNSAVLDDGSLSISNLSSSDSHLYTCQDAETNQSLGSIKLTVKSVPPSVNNLTIITHSVYALVTCKFFGAHQEEFEIME